MARALLIKVRGWGAGLAQALSIQVRDLGARLALALSIKVRGWGAGWPRALSIKVRDWGAGAAQGPKHCEPLRWFPTSLIAHCHILMRASLERV